ncbi:uncharacterized protein AB675_1239 [Cyphellophora attinorum]|uniref:Transcription factor tau subunit sfc6 n=1 Tax=Cyphellophora attinorum TaxID=1664694 RepID=A0A0N0NIR5_9EURO|nr:uncharacterized protein AB675_1239 [Phialophora attinorum]KPI35759.1 hypothetical protein AB675_1239 [Phialophora attinorum]
MADTPPVRRSGRKRKVNTRYAGADWDRDALRRIRATSTSSGSSPSDSGNNLEPSDDVDFYGGRDDGTLVDSLVHGPSREDSAPIRHVRSIWLRGRDATLPSRTTLLNPEASFMHLVEADQKRAAEMVLAEPEGFELESKTEEERSTMVSYLDHQCDLDDAQLSQLDSRQRLTEIDKNTATGRRYIAAANAHTVIAGPLHSQRACVVDALGFHPLQTSANPDENSGWLINIGGSAQCAAWAPRPARSIRRVNVTVFWSAVHKPPMQRADVAFQGRAATKDDLLDLDTESPPRLVQVIGINAGDVQELKWAPTSSRITDVDLPHLLAVLSTDSHLRILACDLSGESYETTWLELSTPVVDISPPTSVGTTPTITGEDPVFSTFAWLSSHELILGTHTGANRSSSHPPHTLPNTISPPDLHHSVAPALPLFPPTHRFNATSSAACDLNLITLTPAHPSATVHTHYQRLPSLLLTYSPYTRSFITIYPIGPIRSATTNHTIDDPPGESTSTPTLIAHHLRRFTSTAQQLAHLPL